MDIKTFISTKTSFQSLQPSIDGNRFEVNQQIDAKVITNNGNQLGIKLALSKKTLLLQSNIPLKFQLGQPISLIVNKTTPSTELVLLESKPSHQASPIFRVLLSPSPPSTIDKSRFEINQQIDAKVITNNGNQLGIKLALSKKTLLLQSNTPLKFQLGQPISLKVNKTTPSTELVLLESKPNHQTSPIFRVLSSPSPPPTIDKSRFEINQQIDAKVITRKGNQLEIKFALSNKVVQLQSDTPIRFQPGQSISLIVNKTTPSTELVLLESKPSHQTSPVFKILSSSLPIKKISNQPQVNPITAKNQKILASLKQVLPIQHPPSELINQLMDKLPVIYPDKELSKVLKFLAKEILSQVPSLNDIKTPKQLKKIFSQSGLFLEPTLIKNKQTQTPTKNDFKSLLLKLHQELQLSHKNSLIEDLQQKTEASLAKIVLNQLSSLPKDESGKQLWLIDIPFYNQSKAETVSIAIEYNQGEGQSEENQDWNVNLTIIPPNLGTIQCKINSTKDIINTIFISDDKEIVNNINLNLEQLKDKLEESGLITGHLSANIGTRPSKEFSAITNSNLLDQKA